MKAHVTGAHVTGLRPTDGWRMCAVPAEAEVAV